MKALAFGLALAAALFSFQDKEGEKSFSKSLGRVAEQVRRQVEKSTVAIFIDRESDPAVGPRGQLKSHEDFFRRPEGPCTGTTVDSEGYILTTHFNVLGAIKSIKVVLADGSEHAGKLLGFDKGLDVALIKIDAKDLPTLETAEPVKHAAFVFAIGRSPDPKRSTINFGIVSALNRFDNRCIQTDAELNYGNAGGPLVDVHGKLVGVTCKIANRTPWGQSGGVGFAAKVSEIEKVLPRLKKGEKIEKQSQTYLGVVLAASKDPAGLLVQQVYAGSPANESGIEENDVITEIDGKKMKAVEDAQTLIRSKKVGDKIRVKILRRDKGTGKWTEKEVEAVLQENPQ